MNAPDPDRYRRAVMNQRGPVHVGRLARLHKLLRDQRIMANEQTALIPDPDALAAELHAKVQHATAGTPAGAQAAPISWGSLAPTPAELAELQGLSKEAMAFLFKYAMSRVGVSFGG